MQLQESRGFKKRIRRLEDANKKLALELEHEKGKLTGLGQSHSALREHANVLEAALAKREADLVQLNLQVRQSDQSVTSQILANLGGKNDLYFKTRLNSGFRFKLC